MNKKKGNNLELALQSRSNLGRKLVPLVGQRSQSFYSPFSGGTSR